MSNPLRQEDRLLSCKSAAAYLQMSEDTVRRLIKAGTLDAIRVGRRTLRIRESALIAYITQRNGGAA